MREDDGRRERRRRERPAHDRAQLDLLPLQHDGPADVQGQDVVGQPRVATLEIDLLDDDPRDGVLSDRAAR